MQPEGSSSADRSVLDRSGLARLIDALAADEFSVVGPRLDGDAIVLGPISRASDLPFGHSARQRPGAQRPEPTESTRAFDGAAPAHSWKRYLYPPEELLWRAERAGDGFDVDVETATIEKYAFLGVRACDLRAMQVQDRVFAGPRSSDPRYVARREALFVVAVECTRVGGVCFCASMGAGPRAEGGFDLALADISDAGATRLLARAGSARGEEMLRRIGGRAPSEAEIAEGAAALDRAEASMEREMPRDIRERLLANLEHRQWDDVGERCLACANCTMVCPTCFCANVEDVTSLSGDVAERWRRWDSCFTTEFSYIHGGSIRRSGRSRYRQWMTHKLATWWEQFGVSGCVGCGRCVTWCPVGIDITAEARALCDAEGGRPS